MSRMKRCSVLLRIVFLQCIVCFATPGLANECDDFSECRLRRNLKLVENASWRKYCIPRSADGVALIVKTSVSLQQIILANPATQTISVIAYVYILWNSTLTWKPSDYGGVDSLAVDPVQLFVPDITLYDATKIEFTYMEPMIKVQFSGAAMVVHQLIIEAPCNISSYYYPFDVQNCTFNAESLNLSHAEIGSQDVVKSDVWSVEHVARSLMFYYGEYVSCETTFVLKRKSAFISCVLIIPACLLSLLTLVVFWLPPNFGDKLSIGLGIFLSYFVLMMIVVESVPTSGTTVPLLGQYFITSMLTIGLAIVCSVIVLNFYDKASDMCVYKFPVKYQRILFSMVTYLRIHHPKFDDNDSSNSIAKSPILNVEKLKDVGNLQLHEKKQIEFTYPGTPDTESEQETDTEHQHQLVLWLLAAKLLDRIFFGVFFATTLLTSIIMLMKLVAA